MNIIIEDYKIVCDKHKYRIYKLPKRLLSYSGMLYLFGLKRSYNSLNEAIMAIIELETNKKAMYVSLNGYLNEYDKSRNKILKVLTPHINLKTEEF